MNNKIFIKSIILVTVLLLNIIVISIPAENKFNVQKSNYQKLTINIYDIKQIQQYDVFLTKEQSKKLDDIFNNIKIDLKNSKSFIDNKKILSYAIKSFKELGLIEENICFKIFNKILLKTFTHYSIKKHINNKNVNSPVNENYLCTIAGRTNRTHFFRMFRWPIWFNYPIGFNNVICYGTYPFPNQTNPNPIWSPACGWIQTEGLYGSVSFNGCLYGDLPFNFYASYTFYSAAGMRGFTGFKFFQQEDNEDYYYGAATAVKLTSQTPPNPID